MQFFPVMARYSTYTFKTVQGIPLQLDVYHPRQLSQEMVPAVVYFHGGALILGDRLTMIPQWLTRRVEEANWALISADYRLLPSGGTTGHEILSDVKDAFAFVADATFQSSSMTSSYRVNPAAMFSVGSSAGAMCAYMAAAHATPKPAAVLTLYGMGGDLLSPLYTSPTTVPGVGAVDTADPTFAEFIYPENLKTSPAVSHPYNVISPRGLLWPLYCQEVSFLQYYTGDHVHRITSETDIPKAHRVLFPQLFVTSDWPPTFLIHGAQDTLVPMNESNTLHDLINGTRGVGGVLSQLVVVEGCNHAFDSAPDSEDKYKEIFDNAFQFLKSRM